MKNTATLFCSVLSFWWVTMWVLPLNGQTDVKTATDEHDCEVLDPLQHHQVRANLSKRIKQEFQKNDSLAAATETTVANFNGKPEFWELRYPENGNRIFAIKYYKEPFLYEETYFEKNGKLVYAIEWEIYQCNSFNDISVWKCQYFFQNGKLINHNSLGHSKTERDDWDPESIVEMYQNRLVELEKLLK